MTKPNWYAEKWTDAENIEVANSKIAGAAASMITRTELYINYSGDDFKGLRVRTKNSSGSWEDTAKLAQFTEKFPFFQPIRGEGFCGLHSGIVGTLAKVDGKLIDLNDNDFIRIRAYSVNEKQ